MKKPMILVVLTLEAREALKDESAYIIARAGETGSFECDKVEQNGMFLELFITVNKPDLKMINLPIQFSIPSHFVLFMLSTTSEKILGFQ